MLKILIFFIFSISVFADNLPQFIRINKESGISIRETQDPQSAALGAVYHGYTYSVTAGKKSFIKVKTANGQVGWAWVGKNDDRFRYLGDQVQSIVSFNIPVTSSLGKSFIQPNELVQLVETWHSRLKVKTPDEKHGWIYAGKYDEPWVIFKRKPDDKNSIFATFDDEAIESNAIIATNKIKFNSQNESFRFIAPKQSEVSLDFDLSYELNEVKKGNVLNITHMVAQKNPTDTSISIKVNGTLLVERFRPVYNQFYTDSFNIGHLLKPGANKVVVSLDRSNTSYFLKSIKINK